LISCLDTTAHIPYASFREGLLVPAFYESGRKHWKYSQAGVEETYAQWDIENTSCDGEIFAKICEYGTALVPGKRYRYSTRKQGGDNLYRTGTGSQTRTDVLPYFFDPCFRVPVPYHTSCLDEYLSANHNIPPPCFRLLLARKRPAILAWLDLTGILTACFCTRVQSDLEEPEAATGRATWRNSSWENMRRWDTKHHTMKAPYQLEKAWGQAVTYRCYERR